MSQRTFIEINHDLLNKIEKDKAFFADRLCFALAGTHKPSQEELEWYGVKIIGQRHHSTPYKLEIGGEVVAELSRKKDIGRADALLIAEYGRRLLR
jgi:hypothetical protein